MKLWHMIVIYSFLLGKTGISQSGYEDLIIIVTDLLVIQFDVLPPPGKTGISQSGYEDLIIIVTDLLVIQFDVLPPPGGGGRGRGEREKRGVNLYSPDTNHDVISYDSIFDYKSS